MIFLPTKLFDILPAKPDGNGSYKHSGILF